MFPRLYQDMPCPLDGYEGYSFRVLLNPTGAEKTDWALGHLGVDGCAECARLGVQRGKSKLPSTGATVDLRKAAEPKRVYCPACQEARERQGRSTVAIYGTSHVEGFDFSTPESSLATFSMPDLPDELLAWLFMLPTALWAARNEEIKKKLQLPSLNGVSSPDSQAVPSRTT